MNINIINYDNFNLNNVNLKIYDSENKLIINDYVNKSSCYNLCNGVYKLKVYGNSNLLSTYTVLHKNQCDNFNICLSSYQNINNNNFKTFILYDYFYPNLEIERGKIILGA